MILEFTVAAALMAGAEPSAYVPDPSTEMFAIETATDPGLPDAGGWSAERWWTLATCETGMARHVGGPRTPRWSYDGSSGFDGGLQFHPVTWSEFAGRVLESPPEFASQASPHDQTLVAGEVLLAQGPGAWPGCTEELGWR